MTKDKEGPLVLWEKPMPGAMYVIGCDTSDGLATSDPAALEVFRVGKHPGEWPVQVGEWWGHLEALPFAEMANILGLYFNKALLTVELNNMAVYQAALAGFISIEPLPLARFDKRRPPQRQWDG
jgi:hypothetical protein